MNLKFSIMKKLILSAMFLPVFAYAQLPSTNKFPATGFAGIGTSSPTEALEIRGGTIKIDNFTAPIPTGKLRNLMVDDLGKVVVDPCVNCIGQIPETRLPCWSLTGNDSINTSKHFLGT